MQRTYKGFSYTKFIPKRKTNYKEVYTTFSTVTYLKIPWSRIREYATLIRIGPINLLSPQFHKNHAPSTGRGILINFPRDTVWLSRYIGRANDSVGRIIRQIVLSPTCLFWRSSRWDHWVATQLHLDCHGRERRVPMKCQIDVNLKCFRAKICRFSCNTWL